MPLQLPIDLSADRLDEFCRKWHVAQLALFGSVLRHDFRPDSDIDVLVAFTPGSHRGWLDREAMAEELGQLFGKPVDLVDRQAVEESPNYIRRRSILQSARVIYGS
jgi:predicted nucleotidyltransferase